jgi:hypothetical protein
MRDSVYGHGTVATVVIVVLFAALAWVWAGHDSGTQMTVPVLVPAATLLLGPHP